MRFIVLALSALALAVAGGSDGARPTPNEPVTVHMLVRYSRFSPADIEVPAGTTVRFVVHNHDPIPHELIVGGAEVHERHRNGTEPHHGARSGEVSVAAGGVAETTFTFGEAGTVAFGCHLPGHWDYGMRGSVRAV